MRYSYSFTEEAKQELRDEMAYSRKQWGKEHAKAYRQGITAEIRKIVQDPLRPRERRDIADGVRMVRYKGNRIVYLVDEAEKNVVIIGVPSIYKNFTA